MLALELKPPLADTRLSGGFEEEKRRKKGGKTKTDQNCDDITLHVFLHVFIEMLKCCSIAEIFINNPYI